MPNKQEVYDLFYEIAGEDGCDGACTETELYEEDGQWKLFLCGFMEPWPLGNTLTEVASSLKKLAGAGFGPSPAA